MNPGMLIVERQLALPNLKHFVIANGVYGSTNDDVCDDTDWTFRTPYKNSLQGRTLASLSAALVCGAAAYAYAAFTLPGPAKVAFSTFYAADL